MRKLLIAVGMCLALAACKHPSGEDGPKTTQEEDKGNGNGGGNGGY